MKLYILRHGIAAEVGPAGLGDAGRPLTDEGIARMKAAARGMKRLEVVPDVILASPLVRARHTAEIVGRELGIEVRLDDRIAPGFDVSRLDELLGERRGMASLMVVGHEPDLSGLVTALTGGLVEMKKGGLALVELNEADQRSGTLVGLLAPRVLRAAAR